MKGFIEVHYLSGMPLLVNINSIREIDKGVTRYDTKVREYVTDTTVGSDIYFSEEEHISVKELYEELKQLIKEATGE